MPGALAYGMTPTMHCIFKPVKPWDSTISRPALRLRHDPSCIVFMPAQAMRQHHFMSPSQANGSDPALHHFMPVPRPRDSTISCLALRSLVMRQHHFMSSSQTIKDHLASRHEIAAFHAYISGIQGWNLSCIIMHNCCIITHHYCKASRLHSFMPRSRDCSFMPRSQASHLVG